VGGSPEVSVGLGTHLLRRASIPDIRQRGWRAQVSPVGRRRTNAIMSQQSEHRSGPAPRQSARRRGWQGARRRPGGLSPCQPGSHSVPSSMCAGMTVKQQNREPEPPWRTRSVASGNSIICNLKPSNMPQAMPHGLATMPQQLRVRRQGCSAGPWRWAANRSTAERQTASSDDVCDHPATRVGPVRNSILSLDEAAQIK
jgi:hypothetical protein